MPKQDARQALRMKRFLLAAASYLLWIMISASCHYYGLSRISLTSIIICWVLIVFCNLVFFVLLRSGFNKRFADPSLTIAQMLTAIFWTAVVSYITASSLRGSMLALFLVVFIFGVFRLSLKEFFVLVTVAVAAYAAAMLILYCHHPRAVDVTLEAIRCVLLLVTLMWFSLIGSYIQNLRTKVIKANNDLQEAMKTIEQLAIHDELTEVYNRRQMFSVLKREKALADRASLSFAVCLLDLDEFKDINDREGHLAGDKVLKTFAQTLRNDVRAEDYVARYGGDEFLVIFTGARCLENCSECAERLQSISQRMHFPGLKSSISLTASIGVTIYQPGESLDELLSRVDAAMYRAKNKGKNRIEKVLPGRPA